MSAVAFAQARTHMFRPISEATAFSSDEDDCDSEFEEYSPKGSFDSTDSRRRSQTTLSSYDEAPTPDGSRMQRPFDAQFKPVEGPRGPHLFRASQSSNDFTWDHELQMSPLHPKQFDLLQRIQPFPATTPAPTPATIVPAAVTPLTIIEDSGNVEFIRHWNPQQVISWMHVCNIDPSVIRCFQRHDINGAVLLDLQFDDLRDLDIESFGKRHQLWEAICNLRQDEDIGPRQTPVHELSRRNTTTHRARSQSRRRARSQSRRRDVTDESPCCEEQEKPSPAERKARRGRRKGKDSETIVMGESAVSIVAIEQLLPKPHTCQKGEACATWRKQQRQIEQLQRDNAIGRFPISPTKGGRIVISGDPGNVATAENMVPNAVLRRVEINPQAYSIPTPAQSDIFRPMSEAVPASIVASSDLLGPGQLPEFALHPDVLDRVGKRDPQDNVRQFLKFQHVNSPGVPPTQGSDLADPYSIPRSQSVPNGPDMFPQQYYQPYASLLQQRSNSESDARLQNLPKLSIPRSASAGPEDNPRSAVALPYEPTTAICRTATASPDQIYRLGTPASEMDVPVTLQPIGPVARDTSQSVPPNMQYRQPVQGLRRSAAKDSRRPSLPAVKEGEVLSAAMCLKTGRPSGSRSDSLNSLHSASSSEEKPVAKDPAHHDSVTQQFGYGSETTHAGWMKKRRTKMLRHEWQEAHFRLTGTQLNMHDSARLSATIKDSINVDDYAVACSSIASNSKLSAAMKAFHIKNSDKPNAKDVDPSAFAFQLVPNKEGAPKKLAASGNAKTHHFAVKTKDERIDWMRELMLAKALQQKGKGYDVEVNGVQA